MLLDKLNGYKIILGSSSPRRQNFLRAMGIPFELRPSDVEEVYPDELKGGEISDFLAKLKADSLKDNLTENEILITSDTVVWHRGQSLAKAADEHEAFDMLKTLNNDKHEVITSVCFTTTDTQRLENSVTEVTFSNLSDEEIRYYINEHRPFDKAGAYGIQEWCGLVGIKEIKGSYNNVVGLPTQLVYSTLIEILNQRNPRI